MYWRRVLRSTLLVVGAISLLAIVLSRSVAHSETVRRESPSGDVRIETDLQEAGQPLYTRKLALLIGITHYDKHRHLPGAAADVKAVKEALLAVGFAEADITVRVDLDNEALAKEIKQFFSKGDEPRSFLFLWFSGHGETVDDTGYLLPKDAPAKTDRSFKDIAFPFWQLETYLRHTRAHHVLAMLDSCFSGAFFRERHRSPAEELPSPISRRLDQPVRRVITAGSSTQHVDDMSEFRKAFVSALTRGEAKRRDERFLTGEELFDHLQEHMKRHYSGAQVPQSGLARPDRNRGSPGDVVFRIEPSALRPSGVAGTLDPGARTMTEPRVPTLRQLFEQCVPQGRQHANAHAIARRIHADLMHRKLIHTWKLSRIWNAGRRAELAKRLPHGLDDIHHVEGTIRFRFQRRESEVIVMPTQRGGNPATGEVVFEGAWLFDSGYGCVEFRYDHEKGIGKGRWWPRRWYSPMWRGFAVHSELETPPSGTSGGSTTKQ